MLFFVDNPLFIVDFQKIFCGGETKQEERDRIFRFLPEKTGGGPLQQGGGGEKVGQGPVQVGDQLLLDLGHVLLF